MIGSTHDAIVTTTTGFRFPKAQIPVSERPNLTRRKARNRFFAILWTLQSCGHCVGESFQATVTLGAKGAALSMPHCGKPS